MSDNSIREQIILQFKSELEEIESINSVQRIRPSLDGLTNFASSQLPLIAFETGLPVPVQKRSSRIQGNVDIFVSDLNVNVFCYALENVNPDSKISNLADDLWKKIYSDPRHNNLCLATNIDTHIEAAIWHPYIVFGFKVILQYTHTSGGI